MRLDWTVEPETMRRQICSTQYIVKTRKYQLTMPGCLKLDYSEQRLMRLRSTAPHWRNSVHLMTPPRYFVPQTKGGRKQRAKLMLKEKGNRKGKPRLTGRPRTERVNRMRLRRQRKRGRRKRGLLVKRYRWWDR
jgi:hypothetical protein